ncbi:hypothetical protein ACPPVU_09670 [Mucilaginibacter sp. McL0603]|uniref:hypothetical protein n=1 Tax=Mucilaginibacter sp. McL0603 TaxID=3415670 RepID=UPI003CFB9E9A
MAATKVKIIDPKGKDIKHTNRDNWEVMKPFVKFSFAAIKMIGLALIAVVSILPMLKPRPDNTKVKRR